MEVSNEILDFLIGIHGDRGKEEKRKGKIFDRAFELAYKDMSTHTVAYKDEVKQNYVSDDSKRCNGNKIRIRNEIKGYVKTNIFGDEFLSKLLEHLGSQDTFNIWHTYACETFVKINCRVSCLKQKGEKETDPGHTMSITDLLCHTDSQIDGFTIGQAQKLINMMVKYLYIFYQCEGLDDLKDIEKYAHVPIDSYVLNKVFRKEKFNGKPWSKIESYKNEYEKCKESINKKAEEDMRYSSPFLWELANWPFVNKD